MTFAVFSEDSKFVNAVLFRPFHVITSASLNVNLDHILCTYLFLSFVNHVRYLK